MIVNLTPHEVVVVLFLEDETTFRFPSEGEARISVTESIIGGDRNGIPLITMEAKEVVGLPDPTENTMFIVSNMVRTALPTRKDLASPAQLVRNEKGHVVGCRAFVVN